MVINTRSLLLSDAHVSYEYKTLTLVACGIDLHNAIRWLNVYMVSEGKPWDSTISNGICHNYVSIV